MHKGSGAPSSADRLPTSSEQLLDLIRTQRGKGGQGPDCLRQENADHTADIWQSDQQAFGGSERSSHGYDVINHNDGISKRPI